MLNLVRALPIRMGGGGDLTDAVVRQTNLQAFRQDKLQ
jgi:hypothetical protein